MSNQGENNVLMEVEKQNGDKGMVESVFSGGASHTPARERGEDL